MQKCEVFMLSLCRQTKGQADGHTDKRTDNGKTICPQSFGGIKIVQETWV